LMVYIVPQFTAIYDSLGGELPAITQLLLSMSEVVQAYWWLFTIVVILATVAFIFLYRTNKQFYYGTHVALLKIPVFGKLLQKAAIGRMTRTLSSLFSSAVPILQGLDIAAKVGQNPVMSKVLLDSRDNLEAGGTLSEPLKEHWVFPPLVDQMIAIGEETGSLDY